jgi:hypothetical protein
MWFVSDVLVLGSASLFTGAVLSNQRVEGGISPRRRRIGDGIAYFGIACWFGGPLWWLFYG